MDIRKFRLHYAVISDWDLGEAMVEPFREEEEALEYADSLPGEAQVVEIIGYSAASECNHCPAVTGGPVCENCESL